MKFETVIGLEVHAELSTKSKIYCGCSTRFGSDANTQTCPICLGHPGALPVLNQQALHFAIKAALALHCQINSEIKFDRKNYFYPDLPKGYQISQYDQPVGEKGWVEIEIDGQKKRIGITRLHLEEDAGKLRHIEDENYSLVDYNRVGTPLIEIVSEPDICSPREAYAYLEKLKSILQYTGVSDCKMEEGSLRCDANISLRPVGQSTFGTKTELKNMNSFRGVQKGLEYEQLRQEQILSTGGNIQQETRRWDEARAQTIFMRSKEEAHDYRYFPEPDLVPIYLDEKILEDIRQSIPELPDQKKARYMQEYSLSDYDATLLTMHKSIADFFEETLSYCTDAKLVANWLMGEVLAYLNTENTEIDKIALTPQNLGKLLSLIEKGTISGNIAKTIFKEIVEVNKDPENIVQEKELLQMNDEGELALLVKDILGKNEQSILDYKNGKERALSYLVGQIMKETKGKANPALVNRLLLQELAER